MCESGRCGLRGDRAGSRTAVGARAPGQRLSEGACNVRGVGALAESPGRTGSASSLFRSLLIVMLAVRALENATR